MKLTEIIQALMLAASTSGVTWFFARKKQRAEVMAVELENMDRAIAIWRKVAEDLGQKVEVLTTKCDSLSQEMESLRHENKKLKAELAKTIRTIKDQ